MLGWILMFGAAIYTLVALKFSGRVYRSVLVAYPNLEIHNTTSKALGWSSSAGVMRMVGTDPLLPPDAPEQLVVAVRRAKVAYWLCAPAIVAFIVGMLIA